MKKRMLLIFDSIAPYVTAELSSKKLVSSEHYQWESPDGNRIQSCLGKTLGQ